jgi:hypothetical protein
VVQYTDAGITPGAYLRTDSHWLYFTPLRKHQLAWDRVVTWSSGIGTIAAILRHRRRGSGCRCRRGGFLSRQKRWHTISGLIFGLGAATRPFSGVSIRGSVAGAERQTAASIPRRFADAGTLRRSRPHPAAAIAQLFGDRPKELRCGGRGGRAVPSRPWGKEHADYADVRGPQNRFDPQRLIAAEQASQPHGLAGTALLDRPCTAPLANPAAPLPVLLVRVNDAEQSRYYIDPKTARVVTATTRRRG